MVRLYVVVAVAIVAFTVFTLIDLVMTDRTRVRALNKLAWALIILILPAIGGILWLSIGKARNGGGAPARVAPDDDPEFLRGLGRDQERDKETDERIRRLEQELSELDVDDDGKGGKGGKTGTTD